MADACCTDPFSVPSAAAAPCGAARLPLSSRRRLWDLGSHAHCPVIGVCLPLETVRRIAHRTLRVQGADDYTLHCTCVSASGRRGPLSEVLHKELQQRHAVAVRQAAGAKTPDALAAWWRSRAAGADVAGALWATLTHPRCDEALELRVLAEVHMLQHQVGAAQRVEARRHQELLAEHQVLMSAYAEAQQRMTAWCAARAQEQQGWERERIQLRAEAMRLQTQLAQALEVRAATDPALQPLPAGAGEHRRLERQLARQQERADALQREVRRLTALARSRDVAAASAPAAPCSAAVARPPAHALVGASAAVPRVVLCVGGRSGSVPHYRQAVEGCGAQFLHHDGGEEHKPAQLDPQLAAADLVICQTGCISHDAYWRVKDHCKRHGKRCVFVETPSRSAFERAWAEVTSSEGAAPVG